MWTTNRLKEEEYPPFNVERRKKMGVAIYIHEHLILFEKH